VRYFPAGAALEPCSSSWSTSGEDIATGNPFPLWKAPGNQIHRWQWEYVDLALALVEAAQEFEAEGESAEYAKLAAETLQPALHSCQFWWASRQPWWGPVMVQRGLGLLTQTLLYAARSLRQSRAPEPVKQDVGWKVAAADEVRRQIERALFLEPA
jgi:hypothetical protein